jgi:hypothetical protein
METPLCKEYNGIVYLGKWRIISLKEEGSLQAPKLQWRVVLLSGPEDPNLDVSGDDIQLIPNLPADFVVVFDSAITIS